MQQVTESLAVVRVGQVITWPTKDGLEMGVVIGEDDKDVLAVMAYDKRLRHDVSTKKWRDEELSARLVNHVPTKIPDVALDVHRVPKVYAKLTGRLTGMPLQRYMKMASAVLKDAPADEASVVVADVLEAVREQFASLGGSTIPEPDAPLEEWSVWLEKDSKAPVPAHYLKTCAVESFEQNIRYFFREKSKEWEGSPKEKLDRSIAAAYSALYRACGVKDSGTRMKPSQIVGLSKAKVK